MKGNRSLRPSAQEQHKDFYVHIVDEQKDGIVVRGGKYHISLSATVTTGKCLIGLICGSTSTAA